jgi:transposase
MIEQLTLPIGFKDEKFYDHYKNERRGSVKIRLLAMHHLQQGLPLSDVSGFIGDTDQSIREWVNWYVKGGLPYLQSKSFNRGRKKKLSPDQEAALKEEILKLKKARYGGKITGNDIRCLIKSIWGIHFATGSVYTVLRRLNLLSLTKGSYTKEES